MNTRITALTLLGKLLLIVTQAIGGQPVARIGGVEDHVIIEPGDPLEFTADTLAMDESCKWEVVPQMTKSGKATHKISLDKRTVVVFSRVGTYTLTLYVWNKDDLAKATRIIVVGETPKTPEKPTPEIPKPLPPDPNPDGPGQDDEDQGAGGSPFGLVSLVKSSVTKHVPAAQRKVAGGLANAYRDGAKQIAAGGWALKDIFTKQRDVNRAVAGFDAATWTPVFEDIARQLSVLRDEGKFQTAKDAAAIWSELSLAFFGASE